MSFSLIKIFHEMGLFARIIAGTLALMAVASVAVFVERLWAFWRMRSRSAEFGALGAKKLDAHDYKGFLDQALLFVGAPLATLLGGGMKAYLDGIRRPGKVAPFELARRELERTTEVIGSDVRRGFNVLASVGSIAPFVGLLGTVVGIISAFQGIAKEGSGGLGAVSAGIAEALVVTAFGLLVAIPAVLAFNYLSAKADSIMQALDTSRGEFVDYLEHEAPTTVAELDKLPVASKAPTAAQPMQAVAAAS